MYVQVKMIFLKTILDIVDTLRFVDEIPAAFREKEIPSRAPRSDYTFSITSTALRVESAIDSCPRRSGSPDAQRNTSLELEILRWLHPTRGKCTWISARIQPLDLFRSPRGNRKRRYRILARVYMYVPCFSEPNLVWEPFKTSWPSGYFTNEREGLCICL